MTAPDQWFVKVALVASIGCGHRRSLGESRRRTHPSITGPVLDEEWLAEPLPPFRCTNQAAFCI